MRALKITRLALLGAMAVLLSAAAPYASTQPTPRIDYWQKRAAEIDTYLANERDLSPIKLVFIGDSITDFWHLDANPWFPGLYCGRAIWDQSFGDTAGPLRALNLGVSGDRIEHVLHRIAPASQGGGGALDRNDLNPDFLILMLGINNSFDAEAPAEESIFEGIKAAITAAHARKPGAHIIVQSLLPTNDTVKNQAIVDRVNARLAALVASAPFAEFTTYLDLHSAFVDANGAQISGYFNDGLHPNRDGYRVWRDRLVPLIARLKAASSVRGSTVPRR